MTGGSRRSQFQGHKQGAFVPTKVTSLMSSLLTKPRRLASTGLLALRVGGFSGSGMISFFFFAKTQLEQVVEVLTTYIVSAEHKQRRVVHDGAVAVSLSRCCALRRHWLPRLGRYAVQQSQTQNTIATRRVQVTH